MGESIFVTASMAVFALIGLLTARVHGHGEIGGTICGGLAGAVLAFVVPSILGTSFMGKRRGLQCAIAAAFVIAMAIIMCRMYEVDAFWPFSPMR